MSLYAVKNDKGEWLYISGMSAIWDENTGDFCAEPNATILAHRHHGRVVELTENPTPIVVSEKEAKMLESAKADKCPITHINNFSEWYGSDDQDRLMHAYVIGWTVEKPKRYVLPMEGMGDNLGYSYIEDGVWWINTAPTRQYAVEHGYTVTQADIDAAPDWVRELKPVEVTDDEQ